MGNDSQEREKYISGLCAMGYNCNYKEIETRQLENIYLKNVRARNEICKEISELGTSVGKSYNMYSLYHSRMSNNELSGLKSQLEENRRLMIVDQIMKLGDYLGYNRSIDFVLENMFLGPKSTADLEQVLEGLQKELHQLEEKDEKDKETINYDKSYAIGDDSIFDNVEKIVTIPKEEMAEMVKTLDTIYNRRRKKKSDMLFGMLREDYMRRMAKFRNLVTNYPSLTTIDHEWLLNFYNNAVASLDEFEEIAEEAYTMHI